MSSFFLYLCNRYSGIFRQKSDLPKLLVLLFSMSVLFLATGCSTINVSTGFQPMVRLSPESFGDNVTLHQQINVIRQGKSHDLDIVLEIDDKKIVLVGLAMGQRVLTLTYDGEKLDSWRHVMLPEQVCPENVLASLQLALWPAEAVRKALPDGWEIEDNGFHRYIFFKNVKMIDIKYNHPVRWLGTIVFQDFHYRYLLTIQSASLSP